MSVFSKLFKGALKNEVVKFIVKMAVDMLKEQSLSGIQAKFGRTYTGAELEAYRQGLKDQAQDIYDDARGIVEKIF